MFKFQVYISQAYSMSQMIRLRNFQRLLFVSMSSRLKVVFQNLYFNSQYFFHFTSLEKMTIFFSLGYEFYSYNLFPFFISKRKGLSFFFQIPLIFSASLLALSNLAVLPVLEMFSDKTISLYRPFRNSYDIVLYLRDVFDFGSVKFWLSSYQIDNFILYSDWLLKVFPFDKKVLFFWVLNYHKFNAFFGSVFITTNNNFYFSVLGFLFNGLVFVFKLTFLFHFLSDLYYVLNTNFLVFSSLFQMIYSVWLIITFLFFVKFYFLRIFYFKAL